MADIPAPKQIVFIANFPLDGQGRGGVESVNATLVDHLATQPRVQVRVLTVADGRTPIARPPSVSVEPVLPPMYAYARLRNYPREQAILAPLIAALPRGTVIHTMGPYAHHVIAMARQRGLATVLTIHGILERDIQLESGLGTFKRTVGMWRAKASMRSAILGADRIVAISSYVEAYARDVGRREGVSRIPNPIAPHFTADASATRPYAAEARALLFVGTVMRRKQVDRLIRALPALVAAGPGTRLTVVGPVGEAAYHAECLALAERLGVAGAIRWLGQSPKPEIARLMNASDLLVLPSEEENLPQVLQEAAALGLPFVATDVGGVADMVPTGLRERLLCAAGSDAALQTALAGVLSASQEERRAIGEQLRTHAQSDFSTASVLAQTMALYEALWASASART